jgi:hypothetical protein
MLRYQLNPHFLFNTLNSISTLVLLKQTERANAMLSRLSSFLRYTLVSEPEGTMTVAQEMETLKLYLDIEKMRFEDRLRAGFDIDPAARMGACRRCCSSRWWKMRQICGHAQGRGRGYLRCRLRQRIGNRVHIHGQRHRARVNDRWNDAGHLLHRRRSGEHSGQAGAGLWNGPSI